MNKAADVDGFHRALVSCYKHAEISSHDNDANGLYTEDDNIAFGNKCANGDSRRVYGVCHSRERRESSSAHVFYIKYQAQEVVLCTVLVVHVKFFQKEDRHIGMSTLDAALESYIPSSFKHIGHIERVLKENVL